MSARTLLVQNFDLATREFVVTEYNVDVEVDGPTGVFFLVSEGIRFAMAYDAGGKKDHVTTLVSPAFLPYSSRAFTMASKIHTSCIGRGSPSDQGARLAPVSA